MAYRPPSPAEEPEIGPLVRLARAGAVTAIAAASLTLAIQEVFAGSFLVAFIKQNAVSDANRLRLLLTMAGSALAVAALMIGSWWRLGRRAIDLERFERLARVVAPLALAVFIPPLFIRGLWDPLTHVLTMAAFVLAFEATLRVSVPELTRWASARQLGARARALIAESRARALGAWLPPTLVAGGALVFAIFMIVYALRNHLHFGTAGYDLGQYDSLFWNALHGHPFRCPALYRDGGNWTSLRGHAEPSIYALLPIYALHQRAETLLVLQALVVASAAIPIYRIAARRLPRSVAAVLALAYLAYAPLHGGMFYDIHFQPFGASAAAWALDALDGRRQKLYWVLFILAIGCREDVPILFAVVALFLILSGHRVRTAVVTLALSLTYFVLMRFVIMPLAGTWIFADLYKQLQPAGDPTYRGVVRTLLSNPVFAFHTLLTDAKLRYTLQILVPVAFLPLRRPWLWVSLLPGFVVTLLTTQAFAMTEISFQYSAYYWPLIFPAAAMMLARYGNSGEGLARRRSAVAALIAGTLMATVVWGAIPPRAGFRGGFWEINFAPVTAAEHEKRQALLELAAMVPPRAVVAVTEHEIPHVSARLNCYDLRDGFDGAEYLIYDAAGSEGDNHARDALASGAFEEVARKATMVLLHRRDGAP